MWEGVVNGPHDPFCVHLHERPSRVVQRPDPVSGGSARGVSQDRIGVPVLSGMGGLGGRRGDGAVGSDHAAAIPLPLDLGQTRTGLRWQDRIDIAGALGKLEVTTVACPLLHRVVMVVEVAVDRLARLGVIARPIPSMTRRHRRLEHPCFSAGLARAPHNWRSSASSGGEPLAPRGPTKASIASSRAFPTMDPVAGQTSPR
jgi:hypothetical protein